MTWRAPAGSPASSPARRSSATASSQHRRASGAGRNRIALRVLAATIALKSTVEVGLVMGVMASTSPIGSAM
jgi:hypothetical protein